MPKSLELCLILPIMLKSMNNLAKRDLDEAIAAIDELQDSDDERTMEDLQFTKKFHPSRI